MKKIGLTSNIQKKEMIILAVTFVVSVLFIVIGHSVNQYSSTTGTEEYETAKVLSIVSSSANSDDFATDTNLEYQEIVFNALLTSGEQKHETVQITQTIDPMYQYEQREIAVGDEIVVTNITEYGELGSSWFYCEHSRTSGLVFLITLFFILILLIGRKKGLLTILSLCFTVLSIFFVYIPSILAGKNIYTTTIVIVLFIVLMSLVFLNGINKKTLCAIVGNICGVLIAGLLAIIMNNVLDVTGIVDQDYLFLKFLNADVTLDLKALVWGSIIIGALGAVMDVSMSIASAMNELSVTMKQKSFKRMVHSGMNIGRDAIGTMTNTLILAYVGGSLAVVLLFAAYNKDLLYLFNMEMIIVEVLQAVIGSMGILFAVPATVFFSAAVFNKKPSYHIDGIKYAFATQNEQNNGNDID